MHISKNTRFSKKKKNGYNIKILHIKLHKKYDYIQF